ncbi:MAG: DUF1501 domain-containing protein [Planctomycetota bacterium]|nr:MAG: DUF1501 domain-containing protein [Planctomycetota bacterium]REJ97417.1 MAG: DUF1501 domain-containing protein [Planctomycetota bacterium]REK27671.1 MAG: DUF1501 domain-containing protein [Planctomycetota bacterium]REK38486.1 MAG: DUF1501 domain-containing protein [Planctomycetota bacterium]
MSHESLGSCRGSRRQFVWELGAGFGGVALASLLSEDGFFAKHAYGEPAPLDGYVDPLAPKMPHFAPKAKRCIFLFIYGGPSSMDTFDYKPELQKRDGEEIDIESRRGVTKKMRLLASQRKFKQHGESGLWCSDAFPNIAKHMDELCLVKSLYCDSFAHGTALLQINSGEFIQGSPTLGSWLGYGLGTENKDLPAYVVMLDPRGGPVSGPPNWGAGYMPAVYQGTCFNSKGDPIRNLSPRSGMTRQMQRDHIDTLAALNAEHLADRPGYSELPARIASYELAFQLQRTAPEAMDLASESQKTLEAYGLFDPKGAHKLSIGPSHFGRQCLIARRMIERGTRYVQIYSGGGHQQQNWDAHHGMEENLDIHTCEIDKPIDALLTDLKQRGLLEETLVIWGGEFGRQPVSQDKLNGRDHNPKGFMYWMAGGGVKGGYQHGETDEFGGEAVVDRHHIRDLHATILHLMGLDHHKLTYFYGGLDRKLTGVKEAEVIHDIIA